VDAEAIAGADADADTDAAERRQGKRTLSVSKDDKGAVERKRGLAMQVMRRVANKAPARNRNGARVNRCERKRERR
jgi:hypothetical protein